MKLDFVLVDNTEYSFNVNKDVFTIGRSPQCDVVIPHEGMSRKHCQISYKNGDLYIEDLGSVNGVFIDGTKIPANKPTRFQIFLAVTFGAVQTLKIELDDVTKVTTLPGSISQASGPTKTVPQEKTGKINKAPKQESSAPKKKIQPEKSNSKFLILILVLVIGAGAYYFMNQEQAPSQPSPEQIYE